MCRRKTPPPLNFTTPLNWPNSTSILVSPDGTKAWGVFRNATHGTIDFLGREYNSNTTGLLLSVPGKGFEIRKKTSSALHSAEYFVFVHDAQADVLATATTSVVTLDLNFHQATLHRHLRAKIAPGPIIPHYGGSNIFYYVGEDDNAIRLRVATHDFPVTASFPTEIQISRLTYKDGILLVNFRNTTGRYDAFQFFSGSINMQELGPPHFGDANYIGVLRRDGIRYKNEFWTGEYQFYTITTKEKPVF